MKKIIVFLIIVIWCIKLNAQTNNQEYDSILARTLGADDYGMKKYVFVLLITGSNNLTKGAVRDSIFKGHMANIGNLADSGKLVIAGPFWDNEKQYEGIFILNVRTISEARELLQTDPAIHANLLGAELFEWYGSAGISEYLKILPKITKKQL